MLKRYVFYINLFAFFRQFYDRHSVGSIASNGRLSGLRRTHSAFVPSAVISSLTTLSTHRNSTARTTSARIALRFGTKLYLISNYFGAGMFGALGILP